MEKSNKIQNRTFELTDVRVIDETTRTVEAAISSESPYLRSAGYEILSHSPDAIDLTWMRTNRAPVLADHNQKDQIGVVEGIELGADKILRAKMRFSKRAKGDEFYQDIVDGIRNNISIGYKTNEMKEGMEIRGIPSYVATRWKPFEVSIVSVPADPEAYIGRTAETSADTDQQSVNNTINTKNTMPLEATNMSTENKTETAPVAETREAKDIDIQVLREEITTAERKRSGEINALAQRHGMADAGTSFISEGKTTDQFRSYILDNLDKQTEATRVQPAASHIDMEAKDEKRYSLTRALHAQLTGDWKAAGFEREVSVEMETRMGHTPEGVFIPEQFLENRAMTVAGVGTGAELVGTTHLDGEYVSPLYNKSVLAGLGARVMDNLVGNVDIPKGGAASFTWLANETSAIAVSTPTTGSISLSPKTVGGLVPFSHKLLRQSSPSVDRMLREDLLAGAGSIIDAAGLAGTGAGGQPTGILSTTGIGAVALGANGGAPTYASIRALIKAIQIANLEGVSFVGNPSVTYALTTTPKVAATDSKMIMEDDNKLVGYNYVATNNMPSNLVKGVSGAVLSALIFGDFSNLILANWGTIDVSVSNSHGSDFATGQVSLRILADLDVAVRRAASFAAIVDMVA